MSWVFNVKKLVNTLKSFSFWTLRYYDWRLRHNTTTKGKFRNRFSTCNLRHPPHLCKNHFPEKQSYANHVGAWLKDFVRLPAAYGRRLKHFREGKAHYNLNLVLTFTPFFCYCLTLGLYHSEVTLHHNYVRRPFKFPCLHLGHFVCLKSPPWKLRLL